MKKKSGVMFISIIMVIVICFIGIWFFSKNVNATINDIKRIDYKETYEQNDEEYLVYFWQATCKYCKEIEKEVVDFNKNSDIPIYIVDMQSANNQEAWYDWEGHHKKYDRVIGKMVDGKETYYEGVDLKAIQSNPSVYWTFEVNKKDEIVAVHNTPYGNKTPKKASEIEVTGTPTMILVKDGKFKEYGVGVDETRKMLKLTNEEGTD
ncbi:thioredoxin fold domain-containing protein [Bacillus sp. 03113]|uniref:thioredoxin fold domain-containing protein n=1 Tax=Bacillus sp. 03113 TaxID=2578211 RepID=UPI0011425B61|nr:thioredoxin fold domain-containing protein [Bacillus sp. 03113]